MKKYRYRADIDGLRAVAVIFVIMYHFFPSLAPGGFVGVDIFFVISGYLITSIIIKDIDDDSFNIVGFYKRRIKRIFPALSIVLIFCLVVGWFVLFVDEYRQLGKHIMLGAGFLSNIMLYREGGYFDISSNLKPLLHLWSLGIEEQFYLLWPVLLILLKNKTNLRAIVLWLLLFGSLYINISSVDTSPRASFYLPQARFWELVIGGILAYILYEKKLFPVQFNRVLNYVNSVFKNNINILSIVGLFLLIYSVIFLSKDLAYPGYYATIPILGSVLLIASSPDAWINQNILSRKNIVLIGLISFPLYLWHWPLLYFSRIVYGNNLSISLKLTLIIVSLILAWATYNFIERRIKRSSSNNMIISLISVMFLIMLMGTAAFKMSIDLRIPDVFQNIAAAKTNPHAPRGWGDDYIISPSYIGDGNEIEILFFGDSHIEQYYPIAKKYLKSMGNNKKIAFITAGGCPPLPSVDRLDSSKPYRCDDFYEQVIGFAKDNKVNKIVLGGFWDRYLIGSFDDKTVKPILYSTISKTKKVIQLNSDTSDQIFLKLQKNLAELNSFGTKIYIVLPTPSSKFLSPDFILKDFDRVHINNNIAPVATGIKTEEVRKFIAPINHIFYNMSKNVDMTLIDPVDYLCDESLCSNLRDGGAIYLDADHLSGTFVGFIDEVFR